MLGATSGTTHGATPDPGPRITSVAMPGLRRALRLPWRPARPHSVPADRLEEVAEEAYLWHVHFVRRLRLAGICAVVLLTALLFGIWAGQITHRAPGPVLLPESSSQPTSLAHDFRVSVRRFLLGDR